MSHLRLSAILLFAAGVAVCAGPSDDGKSESTRPNIAPVLRDQEPADSYVVRLPGPTPPPPPSRSVVVAKTEAPAIRVEPPPSISQEDPGRPVLRRTPRPVYPPDFEKDSATYCQRLIGQWTLEDASMLFGDAAKSRAAFDDHQKENGTIYSFPDPTNRYRQLELDFDSESGTLRTVFVYPWQMTWQECRKLWGTDVSTATANQGRKFYSYLNRRLDVLVDPSGKVISLGLY